MLSRRRLSIGLGSLSVAALRAASVPALAQARGPRLLKATKGHSVVTILGFGEAKDESWFSPVVRAAFDQSDELWLETVPPFLAKPMTAEAHKKVDDLRHSKDKTFFEWLSPEVRSQAVKRVAELGIDQKDILTLRPWSAYYAIMGAYFRQHPQAETKYVDEFLAKRAVAEKKRIGFEIRSSEEFAQRMAQMSPEAQNEYLSWLLTFLDEQDKGLADEDPYGWVTGRAPNMTPSLKRMIQMPELYEVMQTSRNKWWANKFVELMNQGGRFFVAIGALHLMGPAGIPNELKVLGVPFEEV